MAYTLAAQIRECKKAIADLMQGAQSATISSSAGTHSYTKLSLPELRKHLEWLEGRYSRANIRKRTAPDFSLE